jgi:hypothetical protein
MLSTAAGNVQLGELCLQAVGVYAASCNGVGRAIAYPCR